MTPPVQQFPAPQYPPPKQGPGFFGIMSIIRLVILAIVIVVGGGVAIFAFVMSRKQTKPHVVFENPTGAEIDITVDGKSIGKVAANSGKVVQVNAGTHEIVAGSDKASITVPDKTNFRGVYSVGGKSHLAVVTVFYSTTPGAGTHDDKVEPITFSSGRLATIPDTMSVDAMEVDKPFTNEIDVPQGSLEVSIVHLCHIHEKDDDFVGCPGFAK